MEIIEFINKVNEDLYEVNKDLYEGIDKDLPKLTELHMHKSLYFIYGSFYNEFKKTLWDADFQAWKYGPVEINYRNDKKLINPINIDELSNKEKMFLESKILSLLKTSTWMLVDFSHSTDPWINHFNSNDKTIPSTEIFEEFKKINF